MDGATNIFDVGSTGTQYDDGMNYIAMLWLLIQHLQNYFNVALSTSIAASYHNLGRCKWMELPIFLTLYQ